MGEWPTSPASPGTTAKSPRPAAHLADASRPYSTSPSPHCEYGSPPGLRFYLSQSRLHEAARGRFLKCKTDHVTHLFKRCTLPFCPSPNRRGACARHWKSKAESERNMVPMGQIVTKEPHKFHKIVNTVSARKSHPVSCVFVVRSLSWSENRTSGLRCPTLLFTSDPEFFLFQDGLRCCSQLPRAPSGTPLSLS